MKLVRFVQEKVISLGVVEHGRVLNLAQAWAAYPESATEQRTNPTTIEALLQGDDETWQRTADVVAWAGTGNSGDWQSLDGVRLLSPLANPSKIICVGLNYHDHCLEQDLEVPERPVLFCKFPTAINHPEGEITWPADVSQKVDYEAELAVVVGREGKNIPADRAYDYVAGYCNLNDVSARDVQFGDQQWVRGKSFDAFCPIGPYLVTKDEVPDPHTLDIRCWVNGELRQESNTRELIFDVPFLLAYISRTCTLLPGDIISTGTPGGVGVFLEPPVFLKPGDAVEVEVEGLGRLRNHVGECDEG